MRRFLLTSEKFTGTAEVWYNFEGQLCNLNLMDCLMSYAQVKYLLQNLSPDVVQFEGMLTGSALKITEAQFEYSLEDFERDYPYSRNFHLLPPLWGKFSKREIVRIAIATPQYRKYCEKNKSWYKPKIAHTWLMKKEYLNDWRKM